MKKSIVLVSDTGKASEHPPAPHLIEAHLSDEFQLIVVTKQCDPEPSVLSYYFRLFFHCLLKPHNIVHTFGPLGATLVLLRRIFDRGPIWIHTPFSSDHSQFTRWVDRTILKRFSDELWVPTSSSGSFNEQLHSAHSTIDELCDLYRRHAQRGLLVIAPLSVQASEHLESQLYSQTKELSKLGYKVYVLGSQNSGFQFKNWSHIQLWNVFVPGRLNSSGNPSYLQSLLYFCLSILIIFRNRKRFDVVQAHQLFHPTFLGLIIRFVFKKPLVVRVARSGFHGEKKALSRLPLMNLRVRSFRKIDRLIVLNQEMGAEMRELGFEEDRLRLIPESVDMKNLSTPRTFSAEGPFRILYCGELTPDKSVEHILEAANTLAKKGYRIEIRCVNTSSQYREPNPKLKAIAYSIRKSVPVQFVGKQEFRSEIYSWADCFVSPSKSDGYSRFLLEAQANGVPCIACDTLANKFIISDNQTGFLYRQGLVIDLIKKLEILLEDKFQNNSTLLKQFSSDARTQAEHRFSTPKVTNQIHQVFEELLHPRSV